METQAAEIAKLNDRFRGAGIDVFYTQHAIFEIKDRIGLLRKVKKFNTFTEDNDSYGEHDFGSLHYEGKKVFWKIDYYDEYLQYWCDPLSTQCRRALTIMLAEEY